MRARTITVILAAAIGLGLLTGRFVLPARSAPVTSTASPGTTPSSPGSSSPAPKPAAGPMTPRNLLTAAEFAKAGISQHIHVRDRVGDGRYANAACTGEKTLGQTLGGPGAYFRGLMTSKDADRDDPAG